MSAVDCVFCESIENERVSCANTFDLSHPGTVPIKFCSRCPYRRTESNKRDFFSQTENLLVKKQHTGEYLPSPKPCGGCGTTKHRKPDQSFDLQFVWPYISSESHGDEIRFSVRSVEKFFDGRAKCTIIGDRPAWFTGHVIPKHRVPQSTQDRSYRDMLSKVWYMATHNDIDSEFVWMMDDVYFVRPFTFEDIATPRAEKFRESDYNAWQRIKSASMAVLRGKGRSNHDYATHAPHVAEKDKLKAVFDEFDMHSNTLTWEIVYGNTFHGTPKRSRPFLSRIGAKLEQEQIAHVVRNSTVLNHTAGAWCNGMREFLLQLLPDVASVEDESGVSSPTYATKKVRQPVKRRPMETHRVYIEAHR